MDEGRAREVCVRLAVERPQAQIIPFVLVLQRGIMCCLFAFVGRGSHWTFHSFSHQGCLLRLLVLLEDIH